MAGVISPDLDLVVTFLQTRHNPEEFSTPSAVTQWLTAHDLLPAGARAAPGDERPLWRLRAALNALVANREAVDERTRSTIESATVSAPMQLTLRPDGSLELAPSGTPMGNAMASIVAAFFRCQLRGELERLRACRGCGYAFVDVSKNKSRIWCDMAVCGSRTKARAYRQRKADEARLVAVAPTTESSSP
jgi:predicted RNA-binding Zn ribbon-like protein